MKLQVKSVSVETCGGAETSISAMGDEGDIDIEVMRPTLIHATLEGTGTSKERGVIKVSPTGVVTLCHWSGKDKELWTSKTLTAQEWVAMVTGAD